MKSQCWICTQLKGCHFNTFFSVNSFPHFSDTMPYLFGGAVRLKWQRFMCINWVRDGIEDTHASVTFGWYLLVIELQLLDFFLQRFLGVLIMWSLGGCTWGPLLPCMGTSPVKNLFMQSALSLEDPLLLQWVLTSVILPRQPVSSYGKFLVGGG